MLVGKPDLAERIAHWAAQRGVHFGWLVVIATFAMLLAASAVRQAPGVVVLPLEAELGWDRSTFSLAVAVGWLMNGLAGPFSGGLINRYGPLRVTLVSLALSLLGLVGTILMHNALELTWWWGVVVGAASGGLSMVMAAAVANRWFVSRRGLVTGILGTATSAGQLLLIPTMMSLALTWGWRGPLLLMLGLSLLVVLPLIALLLRDQPADVGQEAYGARHAPAQAASLLTEPGWSIGQAVRTLDFWLLAGSFGLCGFTTGGLVGTHFIPHAVEHGFTAYSAANALALVGVMNVVGTLGSGYLTDRYSPRHLLALYYAGRGVALLLLPLVNDLVGLTVFAVVFGLDFLATVPPTVALTADRFGRRSVPMIYGWITLCHQVGSAASSYGAGLVRALLGDYQLAFLAGGLLLFVGAALSLQITARWRAAAVPA